VAMQQLTTRGQDSGKPSLRDSRPWLITKGICGYHVSAANHAAHVALKLCCFEFPLLVRGLGLDLGTRLLIDVCGAVLHGRGNVLLVALGERERQPALVVLDRLV